MRRHTTAVPRNLLAYSLAALLSLGWCGKALFAQTFPNPITLSTGQGPQGAFDPVWTVSEYWYAAAPPNPMTLNYMPALINFNCAPGAWVDAASLPPPTNNGNWITGPDADCANNIGDGYRFFRLALDLPPDCNGYSVTVAGNYVLTFDGYVDNLISDVFINGTPQGISGGGYAAGSQLTFTLNGPWVVGTNYVDVMIYNSPNGGQANPYGLLLVANTSTPIDTDQDGISNIDDLCPCDPGNNSIGCMDPGNPQGCDIDAIRQAFTNAGCTEMTGCVSNCSMYFLNPQSMSGSQAQTFAQTLGANLVSVQSQAENDCIITSLNEMGQSGVIWIGFNDEAVEGSFVWYDQAPVVYTNWAPGEPNNAGNEDCTQIYPDGMWNDLSATTANAKSIIEVNLCPVVNAGPDIAICTGSTANLAASNALFGSPQYTYDWDNGVQGQPNPVSPIVDTDYSVEVTDRYSCTTDDQVHVTVNPLPTPDAGSYNAVCTDAPNVPLAGTPAGGTFTGTGVSAGSFDPSAGSQTVTYTYTNPQGCTGTANATITVNPLPNVTAGNYNAACSNGPDVGLAGTPLGGTFSGTGVTGNNFDPSVGTQTLTYTYTNANGCTNTATATITVNPGPAVNAGVDQAVCAGTTVTLTGTGATNYSWSNGVWDNVAFTPLTTVTYTLTGTEANGCSGTDQVTVTVYPLPNINAGADQDLCAGTPVVLSGSGGVSYTWTNGVTNGTTFTPPNGSTTYTVTGTDANGCQNTDQVTLDVIPVPIAAISSTDALIGNPVMTITFDNGSQFATSYSWDFDNGFTDATTNVNESTLSSFAGIGEYYVVLTASNGICASDDTLLVIVNPFDPPIVHVPNVFTPNGDGTNDFFFIEVENGASLEAVIVNRWGNHIFDLEKLTDQWDGTLSGNAASEGTYFYKYVATGLDGSTVTGQGFVELIR